MLATCSRVCFLIGITVLASTALVSFPLQAGEEDWAPIGPPSGTITVLAIDPRAPRVLYAGTDGGGIFKSTDGARNWIAINRGLENFHIRDLKVDPVRSNVLYASTRNGSLLRSTDAGASWELATQGLSGCTNTSCIPRLAIVSSPSRRVTLYAATGHSVFKSMDRGTKWEPAGLVPGYEVVSLAIHPQSPQIVLAGTNVALARTTDGGATWAWTGLLGLYIHAVAFDPVRPSTIYAASHSGQAPALFKSTDGGTSWRPLEKGLGHRKVFALAIHPRSTRILYAGTEAGVFRSTDGGNSWSLASQGIPRGRVGALALDPNSPQTVYAGTGVPDYPRAQGSGVFKTLDGGGHWRPVRQGLSASFVKSIAFAPDRPGALYAGTLGMGVFETRDEGTTWTERRAGLETGLAHDFEIDPAPPSIFYAGTPTGFFRSDDGGASWKGSRLVDPETGGTFEVLAIAFDPIHRFTVYAGGSRRVFRSTDGGETWRALPKLAGVQIMALTVDPTSPSILYAGGIPVIGDGPLRVLRSLDSGETWVPMEAFGEANIVSFVADPDTPGLVYAATTAKIFRSLDHGATWSPLPFGPITPLRALALSPSRPGEVYAAAAGRVFRSQDRGDHWQAVSSSGLTNAPILALGLDPSSPGHLYAGTRGGGIYRLIFSP